MRFLSILAIAGAACFAANADIAISKGNVEARNIYPRSLSGITYAGGDTFYMVADDLNGKNEIGLYKCKITFNAAGTTSTSNIPGTNKVVRLEGAKDLEAVAWDPSTGHIWAADESSVNAIREYDPETGAVLSVIDKPSIYKQCVSNYGFESVAIGCDGLSMWICNEEGLKCDDSRSSPTKGTVSGFQSFRVRRFMIGLNSRQCILTRSKNGWRMERPKGNRVEASQISAPCRMVRFWSLSGT